MPTSDFRGSPQQRHAAGLPPSCFQEHGVKLGSGRPSPISQNDVGITSERLSDRLSASLKSRFALNP